MLFNLGYGATRNQQEVSKATGDPRAHTEDVKPSPTSLLLLDEEALYLTIKQEITVYQLPPIEASSEGASDPRDYDNIFAHSIPPATLSASDLYSIFYQKHSKFPLKYKVYAYFRDQGCCVHTAVNYGLDYAIYQTLPALCHSVLSVLVLDGVAGELRPGGDNEGGEDTPRWTHMSAMTRVMGDVSKLLLLCHVVRSDSLYYDNDHPYFSGNTSKCSAFPVINLESMACLDALTVKPVTAVVRRHIANNSDQYTTVQSMQQNFAANLKVVKSGNSGNTQHLKAVKEKQGAVAIKGVVKKRKRKGPESEPEKEVKVSRHAKHWKSLYAAPDNSDIVSNGRAGAGVGVGVGAGAADEGTEEGGGGIFGWLGSLFSASEY